MVKNIKAISKDLRAWIAGKSNFLKPVFYPEKTCRVFRNEVSFINRWFSESPAGRLIADVRETRQVGQGTIA